MGIAAFTCERRVAGQRRLGRRTAILGTSIPQTCAFVAVPRTVDIAKAAAGKCDDLPDEDLTDAESMRFSPNATWKHRADAAE